MGINTRVSTGQDLKQIPLGPWLDGVVETTEHHLLKSSELSNAENVDFDSFPGKLIKRFAGRNTTIISPTTVPANSFSTPQNAFTAIFDGKEVMFVTDNTRVAYTEDGFSFTVLKIYSGADLIFTSGAKIQFTQGQNRVWITSGTDAVIGVDSSFNVVKHDRQISHASAGNAVISNAAGFTTVTIAAGLGIAVNELKNKIFVLGVRNNTGALGTNTATTRTVASNTATLVTLSSAFPAGVAADSQMQWFLGVDIPQGSHAIAHFDTLFVGNTDLNKNEIRFAETRDPNVPSVEITAEHPLAWLAVNQLLIEMGVGDRIWGFTPVYRNRFAAMKENGIFRIDPDEIFKFVFNSVSLEAGSRFPNTWVEVGNVLKFLGSRRDGKIDIFQTDFVSIGDFARRHGNTLDGLKQPSQVFQSQSISGATQWDAGNKSTLADTSAQTLKQGAFDSASEWGGGVFSNVDTQTGGKASVLGSPPWGINYEGAVLPESDAQPWTVFSTGLSRTANVDIGSGRFALRYGLGGGGGYSTNRKDFVSGGDKFMVFKSQINFQFDADGVFIIGLWNGNHGIWYKIRHQGSPAVMRYGNAFLAANPFTANPGDMHNFKILLRVSGAFELFIDNIRVDSGTALSGTINNYAEFSFADIAFAGGTVDIASYQSPSSTPFAYVDHVRLVENFTSQTLPATLLDVGTIDVVHDYKKNFGANPTLHRYGKYISDTVLNGGTVALQAASSDDNVTYTFFGAFTSGQEPGVDFQPVSPFLKRYLKIRAILTTADSALSQQAKTNLPALLNGLTGGILHITQPLAVSASITKWLNFQIAHTHPSGSDSFRIRRSTQVAVPDSLAEIGWDLALAGADAEGWVSVSNGSDLAVALNEAGPVFTTKWVQILQEFHANAYADAASHETTSLSVNWLEGAVEVLPIFANSYKKKYILAAARQASSVNDVLVVLDKNNKFVNWTGLNLNFLVWFKGELYGGRPDAVNRHLIRLTEDYKNDQNSSGVDTAISAFVETRQEIAGSIFTRKKWRYLEAICNAEDSIVTFSRKYDGQGSFTVINVVPFTAALKHRRLHFSMGQQSKRITVRAENAALSQDFGLEGMVLGFEHIPSVSGL